MSQTQPNHKANHNIMGLDRNVHISHKRMKIDWEGEGILHELDKKPALHEVSQPLASKLEVTVHR